MIEYYKFVLRRCLDAILGIIVIVLTLYVVELFLFRDIMLYISVIIFILVTFVITLLAINDQFLKKQLNKTKNADEMIGFFIIQFICFILITRGLYIHDAQYYEYLPETPSIITWILFGFDNLFRVVLFDFFEIYNLHVSDIIYSQNVWLPGFIFIFRLSMSIGLIKVVIASLDYFKPKR